MLLLQPCADGCLIRALQGHPVQVILAARHKPGKKGQIDETRRFITYCLDHTVASATNGADKFVTLFDLTGQSCSAGPCEPRLVHPSVLSDSTGA